MIAPVILMVSFWAVVAALFVFAPTYGAVALGVLGAVVGLYCLAEVIGGLFDWWSRS